MNPTLEQLARYVAQELERGVPESTLYAYLRQSGWTAEWINAGISMAKQQAMEPSNQLTMPAVQSPFPGTRQRPVAPVRPAPMQSQPQFARKSQSQTRPKRAFNPKKPLLILVFILAAITIGLGTYRFITGMNEAAAQRIVRDADRREDLSVLLSNLSDYFVTHKSYPTRSQLNDNAFLQKNGFSSDSITDPTWSDSVDACTKDGKPSLAGVAAPHCYAYEVMAENDGDICNNGSVPCSKVKVVISLEVSKQTYTVTFDKNTQADN